MKDASIGSTAQAQAKALRAEHIRQRIAFINVELTTALTFLERAATERQAGHLDRVAATTQQAQIAYDEAVTHLAATATDIGEAEQEALEARRRQVADRLAQFSPP